MEDMELYLEQAKLQYITGSSTYNATLDSDKNALADLKGWNNEKKISFNNFNLNNHSLMTR